MSRPPKPKISRVTVWIRGGNAPITIENAKQYTYEPLTSVWGEDGVSCSRWPTEEIVGFKVEYKGKDGAPNEPVTPQQADTPAPPKKKGCFMDDHDYCGTPTCECDCGHPHWVDGKPKRTERVQLVDDREFCPECAYHVCQCEDSDENSS